MAEEGSHGCGEGHRRGRAGRYHWRVVENLEMGLGDCRGYDTMVDVTVTCRVIQTFVLVLSLDLPCLFNAAGRHARTLREIYFINS